MYYIANKHTQLHFADSACQFLVSPRYRGGTTRSRVALYYSDVQLLGVENWGVEQILGELDISTIRSLFSLNDPDFMAEWFPPT